LAVFSLTEHEVLSSRALTLIAPKAVTIKLSFIGFYFYYFMIFWRGFKSIGKQVKVVSSGLSVNFGNNEV
jgi:hypothetical protein